MKNNNFTNLINNFTYFIIGLILICSSIIIVGIAWYNLIDDIDNKKNFTTLLFTFIIFFSAFGLIKICNFKDYINRYELLPYNHFIYYIVIIIYVFLIILKFMIILFFKSFHENYFKFKFKDNLDLEREFEYKDFKLSSTSLDTDNIIWKRIIGKFTDKTKQESLYLAKKNKLMESFDKTYDEANIINIFSLKHFIGIFHTFHEAIIDINREEKKIAKEEQKEEEEFLQKIIFKIKMTHLNMGFVMIFRWLKNILNYFLYLIIFVGIFFLLSKIIDCRFLTLINFDEVFKFILGISILVLIIPVSYFIYLHSKLFFLKVTNEKHDTWNIFLKNLLIYMSSFIIALIMAICSVVILNKSGIEFSDTFHFISLMILPTIVLSDIPHLLASLLRDNVVFGIFGIKLFVLFFIFAIGILLVWHIIELYIEKFDRKNTTQYSIPPEFAKFFSYLIVFIFSVILFYGTFFINYPNMSSEYKICKPYLEHSLMTHKNCDNNCSNNYNSDLYCKKIYEYCHKVEELEENKILDTSYCKVAMSLEQDNKKKVNQSMMNPNRSLSDYLPLSIFLALFGAVMMIATKNLLENYFIGLSLKINPPYEEGERVKVDDGEMLSVEEIGFRATTFYGIQSNAHLVIPHQKLVTSVITNYTKPTLDYREKLTIYIPDKTHDKSIPREAEKILLLSAFINTGVKKPKLIDIFEDKEKEIQFKKLIEQFKDNSKKSNHIPSTRAEIKENIEKCEESNEKIIEDIWKYMTYKIDKDKDKDKDKTRLKSIFLKEIYQLVEEELKENNNSKKDNSKEDNSKEDNSKKEHLNLIKKLLASIVTVLNDYEELSKNYHIDDYCVRRKFRNFDKYKEKNIEEIREENKEKNIEEIREKNIEKIIEENKEEVNKKADYLVNISYYYFALAKHLWQLKESNKSEQKKNKFDKASLELLDIPRVTSVHKRDIDGAFWEVSLLVTVELGEQSDEIIHHINMYIDDLWDIFGLPSYCNEK